MPSRSSTSFAPTGQRPAPGELEPRRRVRVRSSILVAADRLVLYDRGRFRGSRTRTSSPSPPSGRGGRALTHPFPAGGTNIAPQWLSGLSCLARSSFRRPWRFRSSGRSASTRAIEGIATDGTRAVPDARSPRLIRRLTIWDGATGRSLRRGPIPCRRPRTGRDTLSLAGNRLAWTCAEAGNTYYAVGLMTAARRRPSEGQERGLGSRRPERRRRRHRGPHRSREDDRVLDPSQERQARAAAIHGSSCRTRRSGARGLGSLRLAGRVCRRTGAGNGAPTAIEAGRVVTVAGNGGVVRTALASRSGAS